MVIYKVKPRVKGYHGTSNQNLQSIIDNNFRESQNDDWYGDAVYFFIDGISVESPPECAAQYAKDRSWNKDLKENNYLEYVVVEADIKVNEDRMLDLTLSVGAQLFNEYRANYLRKLEEDGKKIYGKFIDADVINTMRKNIGIEFVKGNVYIKFGSQRVQRVDSRIPNVTIFAINNPAKNIPRLTIKEHSKGEIL